MKLPLLQHRQLESTYHPEIKRTKLLDEKEEGFRKWNRSRWSNILSVRGTTVCFTIDIAVSETIQDNKNCSVLPTLSRGSIGNRLSTLQRQRIERLRLLGSPLKLILRASEGMMGWNICRMCLKTNSSYILLALYLQ
ncbi:uncharacterized protein LOC132603431 isoform X1 [Lycium barbarum]|uniref:uncharacterized protein LOC132603431 isoform X1 n=1 Tax=Lycium barbarum TaxID=112863 RepID=UPI00293E131D|nr:uncharacterized protein LOC132603431 isoform X1 [Lycium barbarum]XP_060172468.1 uncharacterized protein LOC132603431 isoform X1 [Lycium barbarum]